MESSRRHYFRKRNSPTENLTFIALMAGFDAIVSLIAALLPLSAVFVMVFVPLTSAAVAIFCKNRFLPVYLFSALGICLALSAWNITNTVFYVFPALLTGSLYGLLWKAKVPYSLNLFATSLLSLGLFYVSLLFLRAVTGVDMVAFLLQVIQKQNDPLAPEIFPTFAFAYSLAQMALTHLFLETQLSRLQSPDFREDYMAPVATLSCFVFNGISAILAFFHTKTAYLFLVFGIYWALFALYSVIVSKRKIAYVILGILFFGSWLGFAASYPVVPKGNGLALLSLPLLPVGIVGFLNYVLLRKSGNAPKMDI